jgi:hypothetical protein
MSMSVASATISVRRSSPNCLRICWSSSTMISRTSFSEPRISRSFAISARTSLNSADDLFPLEAREPVEAHVQDGLRLHLVEPEDLAALAALVAEGGADELLEGRARHRDLGREARPGLLRVLGRPDDLDDEVEVGQGQGQAAQQMRPLLGLLQVELGPPNDDRLAVVDEVAQEGRAGAGRAAGSRRSRGR